MALSILPLKRVNLMFKNEYLNRAFLGGCTLFCFFYLFDGGESRQAILFKKPEK